MVTPKLIAQLLTLGVVLALLPTVVVSLPVGQSTAARADDQTVSQDNLRTGWDPNEPSLTPTVVGGGSFGQIFSTAVNGQVYAQPIVAGSTVIVATENDWVYGINATTGAIERSDSVGVPFPITTCSDLTPNIGITSAPVYDPANGNVYLIAQEVPKSYPQYHWVGINAQTGQIVMNKWLGGSPSNDSSITFDAKTQNQRVGLLLMNGWVYAAFASHCDHLPYSGFVAGINVSSRAETLWTDESGLTLDQAGIWQSGGGLMSDGPGRIFFTSGNGISPPPGPGNAPPGQLAESTVRLAVAANGTLSAQDFFSPANAPTLDAADTDFGSGGPVGLPFGTATYPDLLVQAGKDGRVFLLNRNNLGGREQGPNGTDAALGTFGPYAAQWGHPAVFSDTATLSYQNDKTANDLMYYIGRNGYMRWFRFAVGNNDVPIIHAVAGTSFTFGYTSGSPVVTSNGTDPTSAIVWAVDSPNASGVGSTLYAFSAVPASTCTGATPCTMAPIWSAPIGTASKFTIPATSNGMVYVGTRDGHLLGFGLIGAASPLSGTRPLMFTNTAVGSGATASASVTATSTVTLTSAGAMSALGAKSFHLQRLTETVAGITKAISAFPVTLHRGDQLHATVQFTPTVPGGAAGRVFFTTTSQKYRIIRVPLYGEGTTAGLYATSGSVSFHVVLNDGQTVSNVPVGLALPDLVSIFNSSAYPETLITVRGPQAPFYVHGLPMPGAVLQPGQSLTLQIVFKPQHPVFASSSITLVANRGHAVVIHLSGTGVKPFSRFQAMPVLNFGRVVAGHTVRALIRIVNVGNQPSVLIRGFIARSAFRAVLSVPKGLPVNSGYDLAVPISFKPTGLGKFISVYKLTWTDRLGTHDLTVSIIGYGVSRAVHCQQVPLLGTCTRA